MIYMIEVVICIMIIFCDKKFSISLINMLYWLFFSIIGNLFFGDIQESSSGTNYILFCCIILYLGSYIGRKQRLHSLGLNKTNYTLYSKKGEMIVKLAIVIITFLVVYTIGSKGISVTSLVDFLYDSGSSYFSESESGEIGTIIALLYAFSISAFAIDGYFLISRRETYKSKIFFLVLGISIYAITAGRKSLLIWPMLFWLMGILLSRCEYQKEKNEKTETTIDFVLRFVKKYFGIIIAFFIILTIMFISRKMFIGNDNNIINSFMVYLFGHVPVFNTWFSSDGLLDLNYSMGQQTMYGVLDQFGLVKSNSYSNYALLGYGKAGTLSNIYTAYRGYIEDFGVIIPIVLHLVFGFFVGIAEKHLKAGGNRFIWAVMVSFAAIFIMFSFIISPFHYFTVFVAYIMFLVELYYLKLLKRPYKISFRFGKIKL